jgi:hypothetical protein
LDDGDRELVVLLSRTHTHTHTHTHTQPWSAHVALMSKRARER